jgi:DNA-binding transcriptional ArsR family regulator
MGLTDLFSKLIVEHGSAEVQAKHIALFKDQLAMADKKTTLLESENSVLKAENEKLKSELEKSGKENGILRSKIQEYEQPSHDNPLEGTKIKILVYLSDAEASTADEIATNLNLKLQVVRYHLEELSRNILIAEEYNPIGSNWWSLAQDGRKYLISNGLLT